MSASSGKSRKNIMNQGNLGDKKSKKPTCLRFRLHFPSQRVLLLEGNGIRQKSNVSFYPFGYPVCEPSFFILWGQLLAIKA